MQIKRLRERKEQREGRGESRGGMDKEGKNRAKRGRGVRKSRGCKKGECEAKFERKEVDRKEKRWQTGQVEGG